MAIGYVPTSVPAGKYGNNIIKNGVVSTNLTNQGYPGSRGTSTSSSSSTKKTTSSSAKSSSRSSGSSSSMNNTANAYSALLAAYQNQQNDYDDYLRQMREAAENAYNRGMSALNSAYDSQLSSLGSNLNETKNQLANQYNRSKQSITDDASESLRQAYINKMLSQKNLGQQMSALGLTGGATETTMANMANNYGNARNAINTTQNKNLSNLEGNYSDNLSQAMQAYNSAVADANLQRANQAMALENALANNQISALGDYQSLMQSRNSQYLDLLKAAIQSGRDFTFDPTEANNAVKAIAMQQTANPTLDSNYAAVQALMNSENIPGVNTPGLTVVNPVASQNYLANILQQLRG